LNAAENTVWKERITH